MTVIRIMRYVFIIIGISLVLVIGASVWIYETQFHDHQEIYGGEVHEKDDVVIDAYKSFIRPGREKVICYRESHRNFYIFTFELAMAIVAITVIGIANSTRLNKKLKKQNQEIEVQRQELHDKNDNIMASIRYAKLVQWRYLQEEDNLKKVYPRLFILFEPKEIVSGDFYAAFDFNGEKWFVVGDCSGHGVQGAFLSNFTMGEIRRLIDAGAPSNPSDLLNLINKSFCDNFGGIVEENFSCELGVIAWQTGSNKFRYSSTKIDLLMIEPGQEKQWLKGSRISLGYEPDMEYTDFDVSFENPRTQLYFCTDGLTDQFGGSENKKWGKKPVAKVFEEAALLPINQRKQHVVFSLEQWRGDSDRTDDIALMGLELS
jgi:serine phosphatase RsbU (regulator of sigma subunit)